MKYIILIFFTTITLSESNYKEPNFTLLYSQKNIEVRQYEEYVVAKTRVSSVQKLMMPPTMIVVENCPIRLVWEG